MKYNKRRRRGDAKPCCRCAKLQGMATGPSKWGQCEGRGKRSVIEMYQHLIIKESLWWILIANLAPKIVAAIEPSADNFSILSKISGS